jgi:Do/DeqQ family serine protease
MRRIWLIFSQAVTVALAVIFVVSTLKPGWIGDLPAHWWNSPVSVVNSPLSPSASDGLRAGGNLVLAARRASPAVVSVTASTSPRSNPHSDDPLFRYFFGDSGGAPQAQVGLGSGVIVSHDGYLLTNNHVIEGADEIKVRLIDGREAQARLVGTDPDTDVAVLKINLDKLPVVSFGQVDKLQVGDQVLAIGNPFNVGQSVTSGIVSALGRNQLGLSAFENFIQTDAAINPGNSGGALVDVNGNLMGINTAIYSRSGGSMGIGFAIPADLAHQIMNGLVADGQVTRGWIGVQPTDLTPEFAESFNLPIRQGVLITGVLQDGPASTAGLKPGDVVVKVGDEAVVNTRQLMNKVAALKPLSSTILTVQRGDRSLDLKVVVGKRKPAVPDPR